MVQRRLLHGGRALRAGYVEGVGVRADRQRRGHGAALMAALERMIRGAYDLGALGATDAAAPSTPPRLAALAGADIRAHAVRRRAHADDDGGDLRADGRRRSSTSAPS